MGKHKREGPDMDTAKSPDSASKAIESDANPTLQAAFEKTLQRKLDVIETIRSDLAAENIRVPGICVAGAQSVGKSSVLEAASGIDLPRGETITTRVPLILRLERAHTIHGDDEASIFIGREADVVGKGKKVKADEVEREIRSLTNEIAGEGGTVKDDPIHMKVIRKDSPNLTLIDLPGIAYNSSDEAVSSDQILQATKGLIQQYIKNDEMIIFVVLPAPDDFGAQESIKMAQDVDPEGQRTLGVVTKCDRVEPHANIVSKIRGEGPGHIKLGLGFVPVLNRTQKEVEDRVTLQQARKNERDFFASDPRYQGLAKGSTGMDEVIRRAVDIQGRKIDEYIPSLRKMLFSRISEGKQEMLSMKKTFSTHQERSTFMSVVVSGLVRKFERIADGFDVPSHDYGAMAVSSRAYKLFSTFAKDLDDLAPNFLSVESHDEIEKRVDLIRGAALSNFLSHPVFKQIFMEKYQVPLKELATELVVQVQNLVCEVLEKLVEDLEGVPRSLIEFLTEECQNFVSECKDKCMRHVETICESESFIFTVDNSYASVIEFLKTPQDSKAQAPEPLPEGANGADGTPQPVSAAITLRDRAQAALSAAFFAVAGELENFAGLFWMASNEKKAIYEMQASLHSYVSVRKRSCSDQIPKDVRLFLISSVGKELEIHILNQVGDRLGTLLAEDIRVTRRRDELEKSLERLERARDALRQL